MSNPFVNLSSTITLDYTMAKEKMLHITLSIQFFLQVNAFKTPTKNTNDVGGMISTKAAITRSPYIKNF